MVSSYRGWMNWWVMIIVYLFKHAAIVGSGFWLICVSMVVFWVVVCGCWTTVRLMFWASVQLNLFSLVLTPTLKVTTLAHLIPVLFTNVPIPMLCGKLISPSTMQFLWKKRIQLGAGRKNGNSAVLCEQMRSCLVGKDHKVWKSAGFQMTRGVTFDSSSWLSLSSCIYQRPRENEASWFRLGTDPASQVQIALSQEVDSKDHRSASALRMRCVLNKFTLFYSFWFSDGL